MPAYHLQHAKSHSAQLGVGEIGADDGQISSHILVRCGVQILAYQVAGIDKLLQIVCLGACQPFSYSVKIPVAVQLRGYGSAEFIVRRAVF